MESADAKLNQRWIQRSFVPYFVLVVGLLITVLFSYFVYRAAEAKERARFSASVQEITSAIQSRLDTYVALIHAGTGLFAASHSVEPDEFQRFVGRLELQERYPGIQGIGYAVRLKPEERASLFAYLRRQGVKDFHISPDGKQSEYYPIIYLEPPDRRNKAAIGYDMSTEPVRRAAMERARDTGLPTVSGRVMLVQEIEAEKQPGFLIYAPVYKNDENSKTVNERRKSLAGFVYGPFRAGDLMKAILASNNFGYVDVAVFDGPERSNENLLYTSSSGSVARQQRFTTATTVNVAGRPWSLAFATQPEFNLASGRVEVAATMGGGLFISLLLFAFTRGQVRARSAAEYLASERRESEATLRKTLHERERAEEALKESEERYRELFENANDIIYTLDFDGHLTSVNKAGDTLGGYTREELLTMNMRELLTPDSAEAGRQMLARKIDGPERTNYEVDLKAKDGRIITLEIGSRLIFKEGKPIGVQGIARDISERRRAEEALREADQRALTEYERLLDRITSLAQTLGTARDLLTIYRGLKEFTIASVPCDGFFVSLYDPMRQIRTACFGWSDDYEVDVSQLPPMPITAEGPNSRAVRTGQIIITDDYMNAKRGHPAVIVGPDNGRRPECSLAVPMAVMGRIIGTIEVQSYERSAYNEEHVTAMRMAANLTAVAIENVRLLERESTARATAEESNRLKDEFLATVSHELRTPLTAILGWSRMLESGGLDAPIAARALETIRRNAKSQSQIIDDILDVSRIITGNLYLDLTPIELAPVIEAAINVVRPTADAKGVQIETQFDSQPNVVPGDSQRLQQVFWNLLSNAIKFTPSGGQVRVSVRHSGSCAEIKIVDNGQGIDEDFLPFVFDRFRQADSTTTRRHGGLGLGLAITRHLVEIHGGAVMAESAGQGKGATFTVRLPVVGSSITRASDDKGQSESENLARQTLCELDGLHVLLVDDDTDTLELITATLTKQRAIVTAALSANEAIDRIKESRPDVIVSDIAMPGEDGYDLLRQVRALDANHASAIPAVAITAYAREEDRERALSSGFQDYLPKPIEPAELVAIVSRLVGRAASA